MRGYGTATRNVYASHGAGTYGQFPATGELHVQDLGSLAGVETPGMQGGKQRGRVRSPRPYHDPVMPHVMPVVYFEVSVVSRNGMVAMALAQQTV